MRSVIHRDSFTPFGLFLRQHCRDSQLGLCVTNIDYVLEEFRSKKLQIIEEKSNGGSVGSGQGKTFEVIHQALRVAAPRIGYEYWGIFVLRFPRGIDIPGPGMMLNDRPITVEQLVDHCNFKQQFCPAYPREN